MNLRIDAPIVPARSLGGIELGVPIRDYSDDILRRDLQGGLEYRLRSPFEAVYRLENGAIEIAADVRVGKIARITAGRGYMGAVDGVIRVGMFVRELMARDPSWYYDEPSELVLRKDTPGICLEVPDRDPPPHLVPGLRICAISVYHPALETRMGQEGDW